MSAKFGAAHPVSSIANAPFLSSHALRRAVQTRVSWLEQKAAERKAAGKPHSFLIAEIRAWAQLAASAQDDVWRGYQSEHKPSEGSDE